jgi:hypothetical protein
MYTPKCEKNISRGQSVICAGEHIRTLISLTQYARVLVAKLRELEDAAGTFLWNEEERKPSGDEHAIMALIPIKSDQYTSVFILYDPTILEHAAIGEDHTDIRTHLFK